MTTAADPPPIEGAARPAPAPGWVRAARGVGRGVGVAAARLRFLLILAVVFAVLGSWESIRSRWLRWTGAPAAEAATSSDTEFFCPMDPGVVSDWPSKCPVCNMALVRRKRGEAAPLPDGVMARMQITPYRLVLGGIGTAAADYAPLEKTLDLPGTVRAGGPGPVEVDAEVFSVDRHWIGPDPVAEVKGEDGRSLGSGPLAPLPRDPDAGPIDRFRVTIAAPAAPCRAGDRVAVRVSCPADRLEPFAGQPTAPPPLGKDEPRRLYSCMEHADVVRDAPGRCPRDRQELMPRPLRDDQRIRWWCPMHPAVTADHAGAKCEPCGGMPLVPRVVSFRPPGKVLAIPGSAAIDDGSSSYVFVDRGGGMFDARAVTLGPRFGPMVAVASGLEPGERVVARGAFLLDAETRLNPGLAAGYFGAGGSTRLDRPAPAAPAPVAARAGAAELDRSRAARQKVCPVTGKELGSMGVPVKVAVGGRDVFVCCAGCVGAVEADPKTMLGRIPPEGPEPRP